MTLSARKAPDPEEFLLQIQGHFGEEAARHPILRPMLVKFALDLWKSGRLADAEVEELAALSGPELLALADTTTKLEKRQSLMDRYLASGTRLLNAMRRLGLEVQPPQGSPRRPGSLSRPSSRSRS